MGETTKIQWTHHTFNPWIGCAKVAPGCEHCYAEADMDKRRGRVKWGVNGTRSVTSDAYWRQPIRWNKQAESEGGRRRVFCASLADVFEDREELTLWRSGLFDVIDETPNLDWLLLTKRPENIQRMWPQIPRNKEPLYVGNIDQPPWRHNVWLGTSISDQATGDKAIPKLLKCRDLSPVLFLSADPLLGPVDMTPYIGGRSYRCQCGFHQTENELIFTGGDTYSCTKCRERCEIGATIDWVIIGGESGPQARPCDIGWVTDLVRQCRQAGVAPFVKQLGPKPYWNGNHPECNQTLPRQHTPEQKAEFIEALGEYFDHIHALPVLDKKGGDMNEWPESLRVREFPSVNVDK